MAGILDFNVSEALRLSNIKRWGIIEMSREQSVAEHSYNVSLISLCVVNHIKGGQWEHDSEIRNLRADTLEWAVVHDLPEVVTGDIPTPMKDHISMDYSQIFPIYSQMYSELFTSTAMVIVRLADLIDARQFAQKFCVDSRKEEIVSEISNKIKDLLRPIQNRDVRDAALKAGVICHQDLMGL